MLTIDVEVEGLDAVKARIHSAFAELEVDARGAALDAAAAGVLGAQEDHPYEDHREPGKSYEGDGAIGLTDTAHAVQLPDLLAAEMVWPAPYAGFVDKGTSRSAPYPFTPHAVERAEYALDTYMHAALENFKRNAEG